MPNMADKVLCRPCVVLLVDLGLVSLCLGSAVCAFCHRKCWVAKELERWGKPGNAPERSWGTPGTTWEHRRNAGERRGQPRNIDDDVNNPLRFVPPKQAPNGPHRQKGGGEHDRVWPNTRTNAKERNDHFLRPMFALLFNFGDMAQMSLFPGFCRKIPWEFRPQCL